MVDTRMVFDSAHLQLANDSYTYSPNTHEEKICLEFIEFDEMTQVSKGKRSIKVKHPIVSIIGNYVINAVNGAFKQYDR
uniref:Uncharacterized protein n=1 Tax=Tanacetum cinerariifolium TaxID=118510 RepID=A0A6L2LZD8_TANCI|nr:hypothetical protein [Tanacetum cinerariifolium]